MAEDFIYLDYNATTPVDPRVAEAMQPYLLGCFGNPSSTHKLGRQARRAVEAARAEVATCIGAEAPQVVFTSGGSESNNLAIAGFLAAAGGGHIITSAIEHPAVLEVVRALEAQGRARVTIVGVGADGLVDPQEIAGALAPDTKLVSVMLANNETGVVQPIAEIARLCHAQGVRVHTDAAQAIGKIGVDVTALDVDLLTIAGHKLYAPKGIGALYIRNGVRVAPIIRGAAHEMGLRAGTENVLEQVGLGAACRLIDEPGLRAAAERMTALRDRMQARLTEAFPEGLVHGLTAPRLPNTLSIALVGVDAQLLLTRLGDEVAASAGAACHAEDIEPSHVLAAMGVEPVVALSTLRLTVGRFTTEAEVDRALDRVIALAGELKSGSASIGHDSQVRLTRYTRGQGCACKLEAGVLESVLGTLPKVDRQEVLVGLDTADDACAWRLADGTVLVQTVDFFTPVVDDPETFGAIAAANALSDVYAMGAQPQFALQIVAFPIATLERSVLQAIFAGAQGVAAEAGVVVLGGHSIEDNEPKFGWVVTGTTSESDLWRNHGARVGDALILTKPLGAGIWATAHKGDEPGGADWDRVVAGMRRLNRWAAEALREARPSAVTDVTGFGLLGHLREMTAASGVGASIDADVVPLYPGAERLAVAGHVPGGSQANLRRAMAWTRFDDSVPDVRRLLLADAQTSGGLLAAVAPDHAEQAVERLRSGGDAAVIIGRCTPGDGGIEVKG